MYKTRFKSRVLYPGKAKLNVCVLHIFQYRCWTGTNITWFFLKYMHGSANFDQCFTKFSIFTHYLRPRGSVFKTIFHILSDSFIHYIAIEEQVCTKNHRQSCKKVRFKIIDLAHAYWGVNSMISSTLPTNWDTSIFDEHDLKHVSKFDFFNFLVRSIKLNLHPTP